MRHFYDIGVPHSPNHTFSGGFFTLNNIFMDDLLVFDATFMDELGSI
jgi:hypothetical protein